MGRFKACYPLLVLPYFASMLARVPPGQDFSCEFAHPVDPSLSDFLASPRLIHSLLRGGGIPPLPKSIAAPETPNTSPPRKLKAAGADRPKPKQEARLKPQDTQEECRGGTEGQPSKEGARGEAAALSESRPSEAGGEKAADREPAAAKPSSMDGQGGQHSEDDDLAGESIPLQGIAPFPDMAGGKAQHGGRDGEDGRPLKEEAEDKTGKGGRRLEASAGQVSGSMEARRGLEGPDRDRPLSPSHICSQASSHEPEGADLRVSYREPEVRLVSRGFGPSTLV